MPGTERGSFNQRDMEVIRLIGEEDLLGFTFEGVKRRLSAHPETLSRILTRLEEERMLEKTSDGYLVTTRGREVASLKQLSNMGSRVTLLRTLLPHVASPQDALLALRGRWFGPLRWFGYSETEQGTTLKWVTEDAGIQVDALFSDDELIIEGRIREGKDLTDAIRASHQLLGYVSQMYAPYATRGRVAYYRIYDNFAHN